MKSIFFFLAFTFSFTKSDAQNVGIGTTTPTEKLDVNGKTKTDTLELRNGGSVFDFLQKNNSSGQVGFKKGHGALAMRYMICIQGCTVPSSTVLAEGPYLSEIKLFAGDFHPAGWRFCEGQELSISQYPTLFQLLGTTYGGNGVTSFKLPDLRAAVPVNAGVSPAGNTWTRGQRTY